MAGQPLFGLDLSELRRVRRRDLLIRFAFGAAISVVAGIGASTLGAVVGGLLLAFPSVLPASVTLVEEKDGKGAAVHEVGGAVLGAVGLTAFAVVAFLLLSGGAAAWALPAALAAWAVVSCALYVLRAIGVIPSAAPPAAPQRPPASQQLPT